VISIFTGAPKGLLLGILLLLWPLASSGSDTERIRQGEYIFRAAGCAGCHTDVDNDGAFLAGGRAFNTPFGTFFSPNITPHPDFGIGSWSDAQFVGALTEGIDPDRNHYYPVFPYPSYTLMQTEDLLALKSYLFSLPAVAQSNKAHDLPWFMSNRLINWAWKLMFFKPGSFQPSPDHSTQWNRGAYLSLAMAHCAECHTPRNMLGALDHERFNAGSQDGPDGEVIPNITPHKKTGIGRWGEDDLVYFLETGATPSGDYTGGLMAEVIDEGLSYLTEQDLRAIAHYILSLTPIDHAVKRSDKKRRGEFD
jgi:mono/diheme cytochrome c family protein